MALFTIYDPSTGEIISNGFAPDGQEQAHAVPGLGLFVGGKPLGAFDGYFLGGQPVEYTPGQRLDKTNRPTRQAVWSNTSMRWLRVRSVEEARDEAWLRIKRAADGAEFGTFTWNGDVWQCDGPSAARIEAAVLRTLNPSGTRSTGGWVTADNQVRQLTNAQIQALGEALGQHVESVHATRRSLRDQIFNVLTRLEDLDALAWPS